MSDVTNVLLNISVLEGAGKVRDLNERVAADKKGFNDAYYALRPLSNSEVGGYWGGSKYPECALYGGAFNHLDLAWFMERVGDVEWRCPLDVQLMVSYQESSTFEMYGWQHLLFLRPTEDAALEYFRRTTPGVKADRIALEFVMARIDGWPGEIPLLTHHAWAADIFRSVL